ncbi:MAG: porin [Oligoflexia bacterium]|nr:porin [Oligoflexia bacterium]
MKNLITIFAAALIASSVASADTANVTVYGTFNADVEFDSKKDAADGTSDYGTKTRFGSHSTNFGIKGAEDIGSDLKGLFQIELDTNITKTELKTTFRNTMIGLGTPYGSFHIGNWDTPFKLLTSHMEPFYGAGTMETRSAMASIGGFSAAGFNLRQSNSVFYWSPKLYGFSAKVQYYTDPSTGSAPSPSLTSASLVYEEANITAGFAYEKHRQFRFGSNSTPYFSTTSTRVGNSSDTGLGATLGYKIADGTMVGASWNNLKVVSETPNNAEATLKRDAFFFAGTYRLSDITFRAGYGTMGKGSCTDETGAACSETKFGSASMLMAGASYSFSKRTDVYGVFAKVSNGDGAKYDFGSAFGPSVARGQDPQLIGLGLRHTF